MAPPMWDSEGQMKLFTRATAVATAFAAVTLAACSSSPAQPSAGTAIPLNAKPVATKLKSTEVASATAASQKVISDELSKNYADLYSVLEPSEKKGVTLAQFSNAQSQVSKLLTFSDWTLNGKGCAVSLGSDVYWVQPTLINATVVSSGQTETNQPDFVYLLKVSNAWYWVESSVPKALTYASGPLC